MFIVKSVELVSSKDTMISQITKQCHLGLSIFLHNLQNIEQYGEIEFKSSQSLELWYRDQTGRSRFLVDYIYVYIYICYYILQCKKAHFLPINKENYVSAARGRHSSTKCPTTFQSNSNERTSASVLTIRKIGSGMDLIWDWTSFETGSKPFLAQHHTPKDQGLIF